MKHKPTPEDLEAERLLADIRNDYDGVPVTPDVVRNVILQVAGAYEKVTEIGRSNSGYWIDRFLAETHLAPGAPWCMAFVQLVVRQACDILGIEDILPHDSASTRNVWEWAKDHDLVTTDPADVHTGDILIWSNGAKWTGHTGIVTGIDAGRIDTIEGNVSGDSWREGGMVDTRSYEIRRMLYGKPSKVHRWTRGAISVHRLVDAFAGELPQYAHAEADGRETGGELPAAEAGASSPSADPTA